MLFWRLPYEGTNFTLCRLRKQFNSGAVNDHWKLNTSRRQRTLCASQSGCAPWPSFWCERWQIKSAHNSGKIGQQPIGDDHTEQRLPTSHNSSVLTTVASNGVRGSIKDERAPNSLTAVMRERKSKRRFITSEEIAGYNSANFKPINQGLTENAAQTHSRPNCQPFLVGLNI